MNEEEASADEEESVLDDLEESLALLLFLLASFNRFLDCSGASSNCSDNRRLEPN